MDTYVSFVTNRDFEKAVRHVLAASDSAKDFQSSVKEAVAKEDIFACGLFNNSVDPFKMKFNISMSSQKEWLKNEIKRQIDKTFEQKIGEFHQILLGSVQGWRDLGIGDKTKVDLFHEDKEISIELKNKFNTCNSSSLAQVREKLEAIVNASETASAYWAFIIPNTKKKWGTKVWVKKGCRTNERLFKCWGRDVYKLVTDNAGALDETYEALPKAIKKINGDKGAPTSDDDIAYEIYEVLLPHTQMIIDQLYSRTLKKG